MTVAQALLVRRLQRTWQGEACCAAPPINNGHQPGRDDDCCR